jgi:hypothetical protein
LATKAQLEAELADLKRQLALRETVDETANAKPDTTPDNGPAVLAAEAQAQAQAQALDWDEQVQGFLKEIEELPEKNPLLLALGALVLGYLIGRSR